MTKKVRVNINEGNTDELDFCVYSKLLQKPFDSIEELRAAEDAYKAEQEAKVAKAAAKKSEATKVEDAFKALNQARRDYKENMLKLASMYQAELKRLQADMEADCGRVKAALADAEAAYSTALKEFTDKYPEGYHITLKDGDFETTISSKTKNVTASKEVDKLFNMLDWMFRY